ncbi:transposase, partial [Klebsiella quasipneumoniae]
VVPQSLPAFPTLLSVDVINDPLPAAENDTLCTFSSAHASATSCHVEFRHGKMTLENPSSELLTVLIRELTGRTQ